MYIQHPAPPRSLDAAGLSPILAHLAGPLLRIAGTNALGAAGVYSPVELEDDGQEPWPARGVARALHRVSCGVDSAGHGWADTGAAQSSPGVASCHRHGGSVGTGEKSVLARSLWEEEADGEHGVSTTKRRCVMMWAKGAAVSGRTPLSHLAFLEAVHGNEERENARTRVYAGEEKYQALLKAGVNTGGELC
ncbi:unnamed protein product [Ectocarpus sp. 4 AP-2014]